MTTLLVLSLMFFAAVCSLVLIPLYLLKVLLTVVGTVLVIPFQILGGLLGGLFRVMGTGLFWLVVLMVPLALVALPLTILAFFAWIVYRVFRPKRAPQAYVVA